MVVLPRRVSSKVTPNVANRDIIRSKFGRIDFIPDLISSIPTLVSSLRYHQEVYDKISYKNTADPLTDGPVT